MPGSPQPRMLAAMDDFAKRITLVYFDAGGGHRAAARALQTVFKQQQRPWSASLVNLFAAIDPGQRFQRALGCAPEDFYNGRLARGWTYGMSHELRLLQLLIRLAHRPLVRALQQHWRTTRPQLVLSLVPNFNRCLYDSLASALPDVPFATLLTDIADAPPHFWIERGQQQHLIVGSARAHQQARVAGYTDAQISQVSGMLLHPGFYAATPAPSARELALRELGLDPSDPVGIVSFGGQGSMQMLRIARALPEEQLILLCGRNEALRQRLERESSGGRRQIAHGYTEQMAALLRLGDYFIGKPGPGSLSEALHCGLPVISFDGSGVMPQERYNAHWLRDEGLGVVLRSVAEIRNGVKALRAQLPYYRKRVARLENRAIFEVPEILERLLNEAARSASRPHTAGLMPQGAAPLARTVPLGNSMQVKRS